MLSRSIEENISEYVLYLWQMEDLLRAFEFDLEKINEHYITPSINDQVQARRELNKLSVFSAEMQSEKITQKGHMNRTLKWMAELESLHQLLLREVKDKKYSETYEAAKPFILDFVQSKATNKKMFHTEAGLNIMYGILMLRLKKKDISKETQEALVPIRKMLAHLSQTYIQLKQQ